MSRGTCDPVNAFGAAVAAALSLSVAHAAIPTFNFQAMGYETLEAADSAVDQFTSTSLAVLTQASSSAPAAPPTTAALVVFTQNGTLIAKTALEENTFNPNVLVSLGDGLRVAAIAADDKLASARILQPASAAATLSIDDLSDGQMGNDVPSMFVGLSGSGASGGPVLVAAATTSTGGGGGAGGTQPTPPRPLAFWDVAVDTESAQHHLTSASDSVSALTAASSVVAVSHADGTLMLIKVASGKISAPSSHSFTLGSSEELQVAASPSGDLIAAGSPSEGAFLLFSGADGDIVATLNRSDAAAVGGLAFTTAGRVVVLGKVDMEREVTGNECPPPSDENSTCTISDEQPALQVWSPPTTASSTDWNNTIHIVGADFDAIFPLSAESVVLSDKTFSDHRLLDAISGSIDPGLRDNLLETQGSETPVLMALGSNQRFAVATSTALTFPSHCPRSGEGPLSTGACAACSLGYANGESHSFCTACLPGRFASQEGSMRCEECRAGTVTPASASPLCTSCDPGTFAFGTALTACTSCPAGTVAPKAGAPECRACQANTFQPEEGQTECIACEDASSAQTAGSTDTRSTTGEDQAQGDGGDPVCPLAAVASLPASLYEQGSQYALTFPLDDFVANRISEYNQAITILYYCVGVFFAMCAVLVAIFLTCPFTNSLRPWVVARLKKLDSFADDYILQEEEFVSRSKRQLAAGGFLRVMHLLGLMVVIASLALGFYLTNADQQTIFHGSRFEESVTSFESTTSVTLFGDANNLNFTCEARTSTGIPISRADSVATHAAKRVAVLHRVEVPTSFVVECERVAQRRSTPVHALSYSVRAFSDVGVGEFAGSAAPASNESVGEDASVSMPLSSLILLLNDTLEESIKYGAEFNLAEAPESVLRPVTQADALGRGSNGVISFRVDRASGLKELQVTQKHTWVAVLSQVLAISGGIASAAAFFAKRFYSWYADSRRGRDSKGAKLYNVAHIAITGSSVHSSTPTKDDASGPSQDEEQPGASTWQGHPGRKKAAVVAAYKVKTPRADEEERGRSRPASNPDDSGEYSNVLRRLEALERRLRSKSRRHRTHRSRGPEARGSGRRRGGNTSDAQPEDVSSTLT